MTSFLGAIIGAITTLAGFFISLATFFTGAFLQLAATSLNNILSPNFISWSYTNPADNPFIAVGWELTRGLTNIIFVLALVAIGLGTALRISDYQAKKALPRLIVIALLINFTPVILGLLVDATNIVMNYFLQAGFAGGNIIANQWTAAWNMFGEFSDFWNPMSHINKLVGLITINAFNVVSGLVLFSFSTLFIIRYIAIWTLVILSPLAFACNILPATKKYWTLWWNQFIQWSIIGLVGSFFLYLSDQVIKLVLTDKTGFTNLAAKSPGDPSGLMNTVLPWGIAIVFLIMGFMLSLQTSATGASQIMNLSNKGGKWLVTRRPVALGLGKLAGGTSKALMASQKLEGWAGKYKMGWLAKGLTSPLWATRKLTAAPLAKYAAQTRQFQIPKEFDEMSSAEQANMVKMQTSHGDRLKLVSRMVKLNTLKDEKDIQDLAVQDAAKLGESPYYKKELSAIHDAMPDKITAKMKIDFAVGDEKNKMETKIDNMVNEIEERARIDVALNDEINMAAIKKNQSRPEYLKDIAAGTIHTKEMKPGDIKDVMKGSINSLAFRLGSQNFSGSHIQRIQDEFGSEVLRGVFEGVGGLNSVADTPKKLEELHKKNPNLVGALMTNPALQQVAWAGRDNMLGPDGQPTIHFDAFQRKNKIEDKLKELFKTNPAFENVYNNEIKVAENKIKKAKRSIIEDQRFLREAQLAGAKTSVKKYKQDMAGLRVEIDKNEVDIENKVKAAGFEKDWEEITKLKGRE